MPHLVILVAYDGTSYFGWQKTRQGPSIEEELEKALQKIFQEPISLQAASRTDRGVHAEGQVVSFTTSTECKDLHRLKISLNQLLPSDIRCRKAAVPPSHMFHPSLDVLRKRYRYSISTGDIQLPFLRFTHWHVHHPFNRDLLKESTTLFLGTKDFRGLCNRRADLDEENTMRTVFSIDVHENEQQNSITITIEADHFLYKMARNIIGTMMWAAQGKIPLSSILAALDTRKRALAGITAPAHGLFLNVVFYSTSLFDSV
jgi:tRNA pseudouridine38-40 synthase